MKTAKPAWWLLYVLVFGLFLVLVGELFDPVVGLHSEAVEAAIVILGFAAMILWFNRNRGALERDEARKSSGALYKITIYEPLVARPDQEERDGAAGSGKLAREREARAAESVEKEPAMRS